MNESQMNELKWMNWKSKQHNAFWEIIFEPVCARKGTFVLKIFKMDNFGMKHEEVEGKYTSD